MAAGQYGGASFEAVEQGTTGEEVVPFLSRRDKTVDDNHNNVTAGPALGFGYNDRYRKVRDGPFRTGFLVSATATVGVGIIAVFNRNPDYHRVGSASYDSRQGSCTLPEADSTHSRNLIANLGTYFGVGDGQWNSPLEAAFYVLVVTCILSLPLGFVLLRMLRRFTKDIVHITTVLFYTSQLLVIVYALVPCAFYHINHCQNSSITSGTQIYSIAFLMALNVLNIWNLYRNWDRIPLSISVIKTACDALQRNLKLLLFLLGVDLLNCLYLILAALLLFSAYTNGKIVTNPELVENNTLACGGSSNLPCCVWKTDRWVPPYLILGGIVLLWGAHTVNQIQVFTISGTISQWYFGATESSTAESFKRSLGLALGPSLGTLCFPGFIVGFVPIIRRTLEMSTSNRGEAGRVVLLVREWLQSHFPSVEFQLTIFTTHYAAITGDGFCSSAVMTFDLFKRNFLPTMPVENVTTRRLLVQAAAVLALVYAVSVWGVLVVFVQDGHRFRFEVTMLGILAFGVMSMFLMYYCYILQHVVNAEYICYAIDKDHNEVSHSEVHNVYVNRPAVDDGTARLPELRCLMLFFGLILIFFLFQIFFLS